MLYIETCDVFHFVPSGAGTKWLETKGFATLWEGLQPNRGFLAVSILIEILLFLWAIPLGLIVTYQAIVTGAAYAYRPQRSIGAEPLRFAVVVPAHNEATEIAATVHGIQKQEYPEDKFRLFVLADNCTDQTAREAAKAGSEVIERTDPHNRGKGQALHWLFGSQLARFKDFEAVALVDADTEVSPTFLQSMSDTLHVPGVRAAQGLYRVKNPGENWRTALTFAGFSIVNCLRPMGRSHLGGTADLKGNGMALRMDLVREFGYPAQTPVEDTEFALLLLLSGYRVAFAEDAVVLSEMPATRTQAESQRKRWEGGRMLLLKMFVPKLLRRFTKSFDPALLDAALDLCTPPLTLLVAIELAGFAASCLGGPVWMAVFGSLLLLTALQVTSALYVNKAPGRVWMALAAAPLFIFWKIPLYLRIASQGSPKTWERTQRRAEAENHDTKS
ncbi:MAG: hypothetical protein AMXMBFR84_36540 [Candidatus Hydrogenedentota bacterium]